MQRAALALHLQRLVFNHPSLDRRHFEPLPYFGHDGRLGSQRAVTVFAALGRAVVDGFIGVLHPLKGDASTARLPPRGLATLATRGFPLWFDQPVIRGHLLEFVLLSARRPCRSSIRAC